MKLETFFEKFDQFADAPGAVGKMRELVLELAVQGRLASALPSDGIVSSVIEFRENAAALANSLGLRSPKESVEEAEPPFDVPSHWRWMALADIGAAQTGTTPSKADHDAFNGDIPFIKPADILPNAIDYSNESLTRHGAESGSRLAPSGSLLMVCIGTIGKCNLIERECAFNQQINSLTPVAAVDSRYLLVAARSRFFQDAAWKKSSSTTIAILNKGKWLSIPVPLPPIAEQKRIVAKVDELMALCDRLEALQLEREAQAGQLARASLARFADAPTPANLNLLFHSSFPISPSDLRKSILTLAVQGKLVPQDAEPSFLSLESILAEASVNGVSKGPTFDKSATEILRISAGTSRGDFYVNEDDFKHVDLPPDEVEKFQLAPGDLLACRFNGNLHYVGRFSYYRGESGRVQVNPDKLIRFRIKTESHCPRYVCLAMNAAPTREAIEAMCATTAGNIGLSAGRLKTVEIPIPPLAEQRRIVAKVSEVMALVDELETQLAASRAAAEKLLSALVAELTVTTSRLPADS
jgi:type I restriction enzyme S subunit